VFAVKLIVLWQLQQHPLLQPDAGLDTTTYVQLAQKVGGGDIALGPGLYYMSPLYIYFLAAALAVADSFTFVRVVQIALGTAAVACVFVTARGWYGPRAAWIAASLAAFTGLFTFYEILLLQAALDPFLTAAALMCLTLALKQDRAVTREWALLAGILFGLQGLNRPNVLIAVAGILLTALAVRRFRLAVLLSAGVLMGVAPVVIRNVVVARQLALVSSQGGLNFYIGNRAEATGQYEAVPGVRANIDGQSEDTRRVAEEAVGHALSDSEVSSYFTTLAWTWIRSHPAGAGMLFVRKLALVINRQHQWLDLSYPYYARDLGSLLGVLAVGPWLLVPLGITGLFWVWPDERRAEYAVWVSFAPSYAVAVALFFVAERYRLPIFVPLCVAAGGTIDRGVQAILDRRFTSLSLPVALTAVTAVMANWPLHVIDGRFEERLRLAKVLMNRREYGEAARELTRAHAINPGHPVAEFTLGMALVSDGRPSEGIPHIQHAVDAGVPIKGARYALARAMQASGDAAGAARLLRTFQPMPNDDAESCFQVGVLAIDAGAPDVAERFFRQAVVERPGFGAARQQLAQVLMATGRYAEAASELRAAIEHGSREAAAYANLAYCEARLGRLAEARTLIRTALQIDPSLDLKPLLALIGDR
jgi:tetratricopeptide (TPR) repeat protein